MHRLPLLLTVLMLASIAPGRVRADDVTIYRCTDAAGHLTLRDTPCASGQKQQARSMLRPKDSTTPAITTLPEPRERAYAPERTRVVVLSAPQPLYECITPDGDRYTSDTGDGNPRWVPLWTLGYPVYQPMYPRMSSDTQLSITHGSVRIDGNRTVLTPPLRPVAYGAGTWVRDNCHALPQDEVCARIRDRRDEIRRRFFNAMPSERDVLRVEERGINARLANDCGGD